MRTETIATKGDREWQGIPGIERAPNGRLWCTFYTGGPKEPHPENAILLTTSDDDGRSWTVPETIIAPPGATRAYDPALWHDPDGRLWLFYNQASRDTRDFSLRAVTTETSGDPTPRWSEPRRIDVDAPFAFRLNKPTVLSTDAWLLPVTWARAAPDGWFANGKELQGVAISTDAGATWALHGAVEAPRWALENMTVERRDGAVRMLIRTGAGVLWQSLSDDGGRTWSAARATDIVDPGSRFFIRRLASGRLLLINTPDPEHRTTLVARLSDPDDDAAFGPGLVLDPRDKVSYPDAVQAPDGRIYAVHDRGRHDAGEILLTVFSEDDVLRAEAAATKTGQ